MMIGFSLSLTGIRSSEVSASGLDFLFAGNVAGFWLDDYAPPEFAIEHMFGPDTAGFYADGYAPPAFDPVQLFGTDTAGFYAGGYEASQ